MFDNGNVKWCMLGRAFLCRTGIFVSNRAFLCRTMHFAVEPGFFVSNECYNYLSIPILQQEWISNFTPHLIMDVIPYPCCDYSYSIQ